jgi:hypothetical protein
VTLDARPSGLPSPHHHEDDAPGRCIAHAEDGLTSPSPRHDEAHRDRPRIARSLEQQPGPRGVEPTTRTSAEWAALAPQRTDEWCQKPDGDERENLTAPTTTLFSSSPHQWAASMVDYVLRGGGVRVRTTRRAPSVLADDP